MAPPDPESPLATLAEYLQDPDDARRRLPYVVGLFDSDDETVRIAAAWTCCLAAVRDEDNVDYLVRRLTDRLDSEDVSLELTQALDYIAARYPQTVATVVDEMEVEEAEHGDIPLPRVGNFTRSNYFGPGTTRDGSGRARVASGGTNDPRQAYSSGEEGPDDSAAGETGEATDEDEEEREAGDEDDETDTGAATTSESDDDRTPSGGSGAILGQSTEVADIARRSRFQQLQVLASRSRSRYSEDFEALVGRGGDEAAVILRVLRRPATDAGRFASTATSSLNQWADLPDHPHVVEVLDWGSTPQPWLITLIPEESLADRGRAPADRAFTDARKLATALAHLHQHDLVHAGVDPGNVAYPSKLFASGDDDRPLLNNVGLMEAFRHGFDPAKCLDPRYAAPEYYSREYGRVDHQTDIYQLGAVVYRLFTGSAPYQGDFSTVRDGILDEEVPAPSSVVDEVPSAVDDLLAKAMATRKLRRYETAEQFRQELRGIEGGVDSGG